MPPKSTAPAPATEKKRPPPGPEIIAQIRRDYGPKTLLAFSGGKDCIAAMMAMRGKFDDIIPFYLYTVPGLDIVEESLTYYEKTLFDGQRIMRMPHPSLYRQLGNFVYQPPHHAPVIQAARLEQFSYMDIHDIIRDYHNCPTAYCATGVRAADSQMRHVSIMQHGPITHSKREYYPVWDWKKADLVREFDKQKIKLSREYEIFGRSFDGLDARFLIPLKKHYPADFARILEFFPLAEADIFRAEKMHA